LKIGIGLSRPQEPSVVEAGTLWNCVLTFEGLEVGFYWIVVCVSLKNLDYSKAFLMSLDFQQKIAGEEDWLVTVRNRVVSCWTDHVFFWRFTFGFEVDL
jgi:hypothetical protein